MSAYYIDGAEYDVDGPQSDVTVTFGSTVNIVPGAIIAPPVPASPSEVILSWPSGWVTSAVTSRSSTLNVSGGTIAAMATRGARVHGVEATGGTVAVSGGTLAGGVEWLWCSGDGLHASGAAVTITGGTLTGGAKASTGITGGNGATVAGGTLDVSGGTFVSGGAGGYAMGIGGACVAVIAGGSYTGSIAYGSGSSLTFTGTGLSFFGGVLTGTLTDGTPINATVVDLSAGGTTTVDTSTVITLSGG